MRETIFALATGAGRSAVAVVRVSGPTAKDLFKALCGDLPKARFATLRRVSDPLGKVIDEALAIWFPAPRSFTGEDVFELQLHGGPAVVEAVLTALNALGARPAGPGEFTRRAFEAGRLDLSQAEAIADLVDAETDTQRRQALAQMDGAMARTSLSWRESLLSALAFLEAWVDFPDEDIPKSVIANARAPLEALRISLEEALADFAGERIREGLKIALVGAPNAGKSSLLNALAERDEAIVNAAPGTTRDIIQVPIMIGGHKVVVADTAGVRDTNDEVEAEGVRRAKVWAASADLRLWLVDAAAASTTFIDPPTWLRAGDGVVFSKVDLPHIENAVLLKRVLEGGFTALKATTVLKGGLDALHAFLSDWAARVTRGADAPVITRIRHRGLISEARDHLARALERGFDAPELMAEDVRLTARALEKLAGRLDPEDVLERVFSTFCIGK